MKERKFICDDCHLVFTAEYSTVEHVHALYGPCTSYRSNCPACGAECPEYAEPEKATADAPASANTCSSGGCCGQGACGMEGS